MSLLIMMGILGHEDHGEWVAFDDEQAAEKGELGGLESWIGEDVILFLFFLFLSSSSFLSSCLLQPSFNLLLSVTEYCRVLQSISSTSTWTNFWTCLSCFSFLSSCFVAALFQPLVEC